jgi:hypothetical protein
MFSMNEKESIQKKTFCQAVVPVKQEFKVSKKIFQNQENLQIVNNLALSTS